jgi:7-keto-8-aminopelargonate synthetase-like enzyme
MRYNTYSRKRCGAMVETATHMGTWAGSTRNIAGTAHPLVEPERELADLHGIYLVSDPDLHSGPPSTGQPL